jgi:hypothetical protein
LSPLCYEKTISDLELHWYTSLDTGAIPRRRSRDSNVREQNIRIDRPKRQPRLASAASQPATAAIGAGRADWGLALVLLAGAYIRLNRK